MLKNGRQVGPDHPGVQKCTRVARGRIGSRWTCERWGAKLDRKVSQPANLAAQGAALHWVGILNK